MDLKTIKLADYFLESWEEYQTWYDKKHTRRESPQPEFNYGDKIPNITKEYLFDMFKRDPEQGTQLLPSGRNSSEEQKKRFVNVLKKKNLFDYFTNMLLTDKYGDRLYRMGDYYDVGTCKEVSLKNKDKILDKCYKDRERYEPVFAGDSYATNRDEKKQIIFYIERIKNSKFDNSIIREALSYWSKYAKEYGIDVGVTPYKETDKERPSEWKKDKNGNVYFGSNGESDDPSWSYDVPIDQLEEY